MQDVDESFNFGLYVPPKEKRLGKYMSEHRCIKEYRLSGVPPPIVHVSDRFVVVVVVGMPYFVVLVFIIA